MRRAPSVTTAPRSERLGLDRRQKRYRSGSPICRAGQRDGLAASVSPGCTVFS